MKRTSEEIEFENARLAHSAANKSMEIETNMIATFGNAAMRAPGIAAAGGIAALLGFYSANGDVLRGSTAVEDFNSALLWFFGSVLACVAAPGAAYFSQLLFVHSKGEQTHHFDRPFIRGTRKSKLYFYLGATFQIVAIVLTLTAIVALVAGGMCFAEVARFTGTIAPH